MAQGTMDCHFVVDNDQDLQYIRQLGSGGYGSVHELSYIPKKRVPLDDLLKLTIVVRKEGNSSTLERQAACGKGGKGNSETMRRTGNTSKYRPGFESRTTLELSVLLHGYGVMRYEFG